MSELKEIADWLQNQADERMKQAIGRRDGAKMMANATAEDLRSAKALAEKMSGHKLPGVSTDVESSKRDATIQDRIAEKLDAEARQLSAWADYLLGSNAPETKDLYGVTPPLSARENANRKKGGG